MGVLQGQQRETVFFTLQYFRHGTVYDIHSLFLDFLDLLSTNCSESVLLPSMTFVIALQLFYFLSVIFSPSLCRNFAQVIQYLIFLFLSQCCQFVFAFQPVYLFLLYVCYFILSQGRHFVFVFQPVYLLFLCVLLYFVSRPLFCFVFQPVPRGLFVTALQ